MQRLPGGGEDACAAAQELYRLTSFSSAVTIDDPSAYTAYDRQVFGGYGDKSKREQATGEEVRP